MKLFTTELLFITLFTELPDKRKNLAAFPSQIRYVYFAINLLRFWSAGQFYIYILLLVGIFIITFLWKCSISLLLKFMPWNRGMEMRLE